MKSLSLILGLMAATSVFSSEYIAQVMLLKGEVSILPPHAREAHLLKKGEKLKRDSSLYVNGKGFTKIKFINNSTVNLGPNSKMVIEMDEKEKTSLVSLVAGKMRAAVEKDQDKNDKKFFVKTPSAVMGVRGTEFQVTFDPKGSRASLLTYQGQVDIGKPPKETQIGPTNINQIDKALKEEFKPVKKGDFTNVTENEKAIKEPVKINPKQYVLLKKDDSFGVEKTKLTAKEEKEILEETEKVKEEFKELVKNSDKNKTQEFGYVDVNSGFYIPPVDTKGEKLVGEVGADGSYLPPKGVVVDSKKGLVAKANISDQDKKLIETVNQKLEDQIQSEPVDPAYQRYLQVE